MFQTVGNPVSETAAYGIVTRATRVWRVQQVVLDEKGDPKQDAGGNAALFPETLVLKDAWLNDDARLESEIQQDIFSRLGTSAGDARRYFLDIEHCNVVKRADSKPDLTPICSKGQRKTSKWTPGSSYITPLSASTHKLRQSTLSPSKHPPPDKASPPTLRARKHIRVVFKENCRSVFELNSFESFIQCILDCVKGTFVVLRICSRPHTVTSARLHANGWLRSSRRQRRQLLVL